MARCVNGRGGGGVWISKGEEGTPYEEDTTMRRMRVAMALLGMFLGSANMLQAQTISSKPGPQNSISAPDLSKMNIGSILKQMQATTAPASDEAPSPIQIVVQFLQLRPDQQQVFGQLLQARQTVVAP